MKCFMGKTDSSSSKLILRSFHDDEADDGINVFCFYGWRSWAFGVFQFSFNGEMIFMCDWVKLCM